MPRGPVAFMKRCSVSGCSRTINSPWRSTRTGSSSAFRRFRRSSRRRSRRWAGRWRTSTRWSRHSPRRASASSSIPSCRRMRWASGQRRGGPGGHGSRTPTATCYRWPSTGMHRTTRALWRTPLALLLLGDCQRGYRFHTLANYEAPIGRYQIAIEARGQVRAGSDLSDEASATVRVTPAPGANGDSLQLQVILPDRLTYTRGRGPSGSASWSGAGAADTLGSLLRQAGYAASPIGEIEEAYKAITGALLGPKATLMDGQTASLRVVATSFIR